MIGSNPFAYAAPAGRHRPLLLDMSVATVAGGKVYAARQRGEPIPAGWLIDEDGRPTDDAAAYPEHATLTPPPGTRATASASDRDLAGALSGAAMTWQIRSWLRTTRPYPRDTAPPSWSSTSTAIHPDLPTRIEALVDEVHAAPGPTVSTGYVPGEMEWERYDRAVDTVWTCPPTWWRASRGDGPGRPRPGRVRPADRAR